jgi:hypothetical protein
VNEGAQLDELIQIIDAQPGDATTLIDPHIPIEELLPIAQARNWNALQSILRASGAMITTEQLHNMMTASYMDGFAHGCGWAKMKAGSGER